MAIAVDYLLRNTMHAASPNVQEGPGDFNPGKFVCVKDAQVGFIFMPLRPHRKLYCLYVWYHYGVTRHITRFAVYSFLNTSSCVTFVPLQVCEGREGAAADPH